MQVLFTLNSLSSDVKSSADDICLKKIKRLHLELFLSKPHIRLLKYLVLLFCEDLEELEICIWQVDEDYYTGHMIPLQADHMISCLSEQLSSTTNVELPLHSLTVVSGGCRHSLLRLDYHYENIYMEELQRFISAVVLRKSRQTKWRKFWISPSIDIRTLEILIPVFKYEHELESIEEITACKSWLSADAVDELKTLFSTIDDNTVRSLHLCQPTANSVLDLCEPISRVCGHSLKFLSLSISHPPEIDVQTNAALHTLFSNCLNIVELDLAHCSFEKDICEPLSKLKHLTKVQLKECAISSKHCRESYVIISKANLLTFVENCTNITHLDIHGCIRNEHLHFLCLLTDGDLQALAKLSNLESLTLRNIKGISKWTFLKSISENCQFLRTLRVFLEICSSFNDSHIPMLMECAKLLKHFTLHVNELDLQSVRFWNFLSNATNLERLCIRTGCYDHGLINIPVAVETLMSLPRLHVLHLHFSKNVEDFHSEMKRTLEEENSDRSSFFELVTDHCENVSMKRQVFNKALPINAVELCQQIPVLEIPRF